MMGKKKGKKGKKGHKRKRRATLCTNYTTALFGSDTGDNELTLISAVVDLAVLGDSELGVPGILAPEGGIAGFFSGLGPTTNRGGRAVTVNFLDGAADLPNPSPTSNTAILLSHLYQFFGALLGCSAAGFPAYEGETDMLRLHKFMGISQAQNDYFITQIGLSASALGVTDDDVTAIANFLDSTFNTRCPPLLTETDGVPSFLVDTNPSICQALSCPLADNSPCEDFALVDDLLFDDAFFEDDLCQLVTFNETFAMSGPTVFLAPDTDLNTVGTPSLPGTVFIIERVNIFGLDGITPIVGTTVSGTCTRTTFGEDGGGVCSLVFIDDEGYSINVNGFLEGPLGSPMAITGGTGRTVGVTGEMDFFPVFLTDQSDIFLDVERYEVIANIGLIVCPEPL